LDRTDPAVEREPGLRARVRPEPCHEGGSALMSKLLRTANRQLRRQRQGFETGG